MRAARASLTWTLDAGNRRGAPTIAKGRRRMRGICIAVVGCCSGCATVETTQRPESYYTGTQQSEAIGLFKGEPGRLSDDYSAHHHRLALPKQNRVAILALSAANSSGASIRSDFVQLNEAIERDFVGTLRFEPNL